MIRRALALIAFCLAPSLALAQAVPLQGGPWAPGHALMYAPGGFGQPIVQDSGPASGGGTGIGLSEQLLIVRGKGQPPYASAGTGPSGTNWCDYDAPPTTAAYHFVCLSPNAAGASLIMAGAGGSASALPFALSTNGATFLFQSSGPHAPSGGSSDVAPTSYVDAETARAEAAEAGITANFTFAAQGSLLVKLAAAPTTAPGAGFGRMFLVPSTITAGACALQIQTGTSAVPVTLADNLGSGC